MNYRKIELSKTIEENQFFTAKKMFVKVNSARPQVTFKRLSSVEHL